MALKLIHTADWHLGQTFFGYDREAEHEAFLGFLTNLLVERETDVLLIAGDVFDVTNPSAGAQRRFYRFLREANRLNPGLQIVIIAGNHDSAIRLEAPNPLLEELNTSIVGIVGRTDSGEIDLASLVVPLRNRAGEREALCLAVPFLRQGDYPAAPEGELDSYVAGIGRMYRRLYAYADAQRNPGEAIVALGHLHATGAELSDDDRSERAIMGGLESVSADTFDAGIAYTALGHIHKAQRVGGRENIRYAGSPLPMSFSEQHYRHQVVAVTLENGCLSDWEAVPVPLRTGLHRIPAEPASPAEVLLQLADLPAADAQAVRDNIDTESGDYLWHNWNGMKQGRLRYEYKIGDLLELADYLTKFISKIDPLIEDFLNTYYDGNNDTQKEIFTVSSIDFNKIEDGASVNINITDGTGSKVVLHTMSLKDVLSLKLKIPDYQRIYCWPQKNVEQLLDDIFIPRNHKYHLGTLILQKKGDDYDIIDGQQRTVTLALILRAMCIDNILLLKEKFDSVEAQKYIGYNRYIIEMYLDRHYPNIETRSKEAKKILDIISFDVLVLNDSSLELAYTFFSTQNARGKALTDYELLKSHHLRFIPESHEAQQRHLAKMWDKLLVKSERENGDRSVSIILGIYLYCLRKWTRKQYWYIKEPNRVKNEFEAAPTIPEIPPFGERFDFMDPIQGGTHFFAFVNAFIQHYNHFIETKQYHILWETISCSGLIEININGNDDNKKLSEGKRRTHWWYGDVIAAFLFAYYMKFGNQYLSEALTCITRIVSQLRYEKSKANKQSIMDKAGEMEIIVMINQATSPTFFLASARDIIKRLPYFDKNLKGIRVDYFNKEMSLYEQNEKNYLIDSFKTLHNK